VREWIVGGVGRQSVKRDRAAEFSERHGPDAAALIENLAKAVAAADSVLAALTVEDLPRPCTIQQRNATVLEAIYHVVEHFAMHTGQIVLLTKAYSPDRIHFYDDSTPTARPIWGGAEGIR
jgi:uncharacterized damage-inducible protein DinB